MSAHLPKPLPLETKVRRLTIAVVLVGFAVIVTLGAVLWILQLAPGSPTVSP